ncbi:MAG: GAF domain-containing protein [Gemmatimonadetes bacterium]|nr:GAF domain-containing protein [Gemmatimonadota bacterium]
MIATGNPSIVDAVLYHGAGTQLQAMEAAIEGAHIPRRATISALAEIDEPPEVPAVLLLDQTLARAAPDLAAALAGLPAAVVVVALDGDVEALAAESDRVLLTLPAGQHTAEAARTLRVAFRHAAERLATDRADRELARARSELRELNRIGMALMTERDPERLLVHILEQARRLTQSDAGSLYLVELDEDGKPRLRFKLAQNDSLPGLPLVEFTLPLDRTSLAGYAAVTGEALVLEDAYRISTDAPYSFNRSFDERFGYRTQSMLVVPMKDHKDEVVGVLQLINRKRDPDARITDEGSAELIVLPYGERELQLVRSLAGQAAVSIENSQLYQQIEHIFESFVKASVIAIDQRDPTTAGHSVRVATMTCDMAEAIAEHGRGPHADVRFSREQMRELRYAALLHDFGKVGVREEVLVKAKKLPPHLIERVEARFDLIRRTLEADYYKQRVELVGQDGPAHFAAMEGPLEEEFQRQMEELERLHAAVRAANEPTILPEASAEILDDIGRRTFRGVRGDLLPFITEHELHFLRIPKGSLDDHERREIESHVEQTYRFLSQIPWTDDLRSVADIAYGHHEKLDGRGYPRGIRADQIPVQTRMMTIADIFDALTASDRPYKKAIGEQRALDILVMEAKSGMLDQPLVEMLIESKLYRKVLERDWREL